MAEVEKKASQPDSSGKSVQLGIGTLIIIALIVTTCSGRSELEKLQKDTADLKQQIAVIDTKLDAMVRNGGAITFRSVETPTTPAEAGTAPSPRP